MIAQLLFGIRIAIDTSALQRITERGRMRPDAESLQLDVDSVLAEIGWPECPRAGWLITPDALAQMDHRLAGGATEFFDRVAAAAAARREQEEAELNAVSWGQYLGMSLITAFLIGWVGLFLVRQPWLGLVGTAILGGVYVASLNFGRPPSFIRNSAARCVSVSVKS